MKRLLSRGVPALALFSALALILAGCSQTTNTGGEAKDTGKEKSVAKSGGVNDDHSGWWCPEHALPEEVCDLCSKKYREAEKAKGNWCEHNRVKTSCFQCNPGLKEKYAAEYKAKFGKEPPPIEDDGK